MSYRTANDHYEGKIRGFLLMSYINLIYILKEI